MKRLLQRHRDRQDDKIHAIHASGGKTIAIYRLFHRYYIKSFFGPFFAFLFPIIIFSILGTVMDARLVFPGIAAMSAMSSGITGMPFSIMELKKSVLLKRIGASPVKPSMFTFVILTYFFFTIMLSVVWLMLFAWLLHHNEFPHMFDALKSIKGLLGFFYGNALNIFVSLGFGFAIASVSKSEQQAQAVGMLIYFPSTFLSGQFISIDVINANETMNWISKFVPFRYTTMMIVTSWNNTFFTNNDMLVNSAGVLNEVKPINPFAVKALYLPHQMTISELTNAITSQITAGTTNGLSSITDSAALDKTLQGLGYIVQRDTAGHVINVLNIHNKLTFEWYEPMLGYIVPYSMIILSTSFSLKKFKWTASR